MKRIPGREVGLTQDRLARLLQSVEGADEILILAHNDPDPDAIASALALKHLPAEKDRL